MYMIHKNVENEHVPVGQAQRHGTEIVSALLLLEAQDACTVGCPH
jgi:hypothetical protein